MGRLLTFIFSSLDKLFAIWKPLLWFAKLRNQHSKCRNVLIAIWSGSATFATGEIYAHAVDFYQGVDTPVLQYHNVRAVVCVVLVLLLLVVWLFTVVQSSIALKISREIFKERSFCKRKEFVTEVGTLRQRSGTEGSLLRQRSGTEGCLMRQRSGTVDASRFSIVERRRERFNTDVCASNQRSVTDSRIHTGTTIPPYFLPITKDIGVTSLHDTSQVVDRSKGLERCVSAVREWKVVRVYSCMLAVFFVGYSPIMAYMLSYPVYKRDFFAQSVYVRIAYTTGGTTLVLVACAIPLLSFLTLKKKKPFKTMLTSSL